MSNNDKQKSVEDEYEQHVAEAGGDYRVKNSKMQNLIAKILCVLASLMLWFYVASANTVIIERSFTAIPVTIRNREVMVEKQLGEVIWGNDYTVNVTLRGSKADLEELSVDEVVMYVDVGGISDTGEHSLEIQSSLPSGITLVDQSMSLLTVYIDRNMTKPVRVEPEILYKSSTQYKIEEDECEYMDTIEITGPAKEIEKVSYARLTVNLGEDVDSSKVVTGRPVLVDSNGSPVESQFISMQTTSIKVRVPVYTEKEIPIGVKFEDNRYFDAGDIVSVEVWPKEIKVKGDPVVLKSYLAVQLEVIELDEIMCSSSDSIILEKELQLIDGIENLTQTDKVTVVIKHTASSIERVELNVDECKPKDPGNYKYATGDKVTVEYRVPDGLRNSVRLDDSDVSVKVDFGSAVTVTENGYYLVSVELTNPELRDKVYIIPPQKEMYVQVQKDENVADS